MLRWGDWHRSEGCRHHMDRNHFCGTSFSSIFWDAMGMVFTNKEGDPGMIERGDIWRAVEEIIDWDPDSSSSPIGFTRDDAVRHLYNGDFKGLNNLFITGPKLPEHASCYAVANLGSPMNSGRIWCNFYQMISAAKDSFPNDATGIDMLVYFTGAVMLHEVMHVMGFTHGARMSLDPTHAYNRTLPQVAYRAVLTASPYRNSILLLTGSGIRPMLCGTSSRDTPSLSGEEIVSESTEMRDHNSTPSPLYSESAYSNFMGHQLPDNRH